MTVINNPCETSIFTKKFNEGFKKNRDSFWIYNGKKRFHETFLPQQNPWDSNSMRLSRQNSRCATRQSASIDEEFIWKFESKNSRNIFVGRLKYLLKNWEIVIKCLEDFCWFADLELQLSENQVKIQPHSKLKWTMEKFPQF